MAEKKPNQRRQHQRLFHPRAVEKLVQETGQRRPSEALSNWAVNLKNGSLAKQNELSLHGPFLQMLFQEFLGYTSLSQSTDGHFQLLAEPSITGAGRADAALGFLNADSGSAGGRILAAIELKGTKELLDISMPGRVRSAVDQGWDYASRTPGCHWVLVSNYQELRLYHTARTKWCYELFEFTDLLEDGIDFASRLYALLAPKNLLPASPETKEPARLDRLLLESDETGTHITNQLYKNYSGLRLELIKVLKELLPAGTGPLVAIEKAQKILDRVVFIAFAEDRGLIDPQSLFRAATQEYPYEPVPLWTQLRALFKGMDIGNPRLNIHPGYNGGLFAPDEVIDSESLVLPKELCKAIYHQIKEYEKGKAYDFDLDISVDILGHIFEQSITDLEDLKAKELGEEAPGNMGKRKATGVFYTPPLVTRFIIDRTLGSYLREREATLRQERSLDRSVLDGGKPDLPTEQQFWQDWITTVLTRVRVLDPACGSGAFLNAAYDYLLSEYQRAFAALEATGYQYQSDSMFNPLKDLRETIPDTILGENLFGVDLSPESSEITRLSLWLKTAQRGRKLTDLSRNIHLGDSLISREEFTEAPFDWYRVFPEIMRSGGFDVVIGNPPYVRQERLSARKPYLEKHYPGVYHGVADLYSYFFERGLGLLRPGGRLGFVCSSTFFRTGSGEPLRSFLAEQVTLYDVVDFGDLQIFEGATTYPAILVMGKQAPPEGHSLRFTNLHERPDLDFAKVFESIAERQPQSRLERGGWRFESDALARLRKKIIADHPTLKEVYGSPYRGILTGLNEAFVVDQGTRDRLIAQDPRSAEVLKPFLEGKDLKRWHVQSRELWLVLIPKGFTVARSGASTEEQGWRWLQQDYPAIAKYLETYAEKGRKRWDKGDFWWELRACDYYEAFEKPKVVYPHFLGRPTASYDAANYYYNNKCYILPQDSHTLVSILNSKLYWLWISGVTVQKQGGFYEATTQYLEIFPGPAPTGSVGENLDKFGRYCQEVTDQLTQTTHAFTRRIPDLCPPKRTAKLTPKLRQWWKLSFQEFRLAVKEAFREDIHLLERSQWEDLHTAASREYHRLSRELAATEARLNALVYELYDLTPAEIALLEREVRPALGGMEETEE